MQPYFFPYIGYFQLMHAVDKFVFYDDVNFIKSGWINRNRLYLAGSVRYITVPLDGASSFKKICDTRVKPTDEWAAKMLSTVAQYYSKAPFYNSVRDLLERVLTSHGGSLARLAKHSVTTTAEYLGLSTTFVLSSTIYGNQDKKSTERVLDICRIEKANEYWNLPGGQSLYNADLFAQHGIDLNFVNVIINSYKQGTPEFNPGLSIIDVLMYNDPAQVVAMLSTNLHS